MNRVLLLFCTLLVPTSALAAPDQACVKDKAAAELAVEMQFASLVCPKWNIMPRAEFAFSLVELGAIGVEDIEKTPETTPGKITFTEPCATEISEMESATAKMADGMGQDRFCIRAALWLTVPNVRFSLEKNGTIPKE